MTELQKKYSLADENNQKLSEYRPLPPETLKSLREYYRVGLTYTSNALEGNSLTESETKVVIAPSVLSADRCRESRSLPHGEGVYQRQPLCCHCCIEDSG